MRMRWALAVVFVMLLSQYAYAGTLGAYAFPQKGQTQEQQMQDESSCAQWAQNQTGLNPAVLQYQGQQAAASQQQVTQEASNPRVARNIGRAALTGAALGGINENMDSGAGKGAAMGVVVGASRARAQHLEQQTQNTVNAANAQSQNIKADTDKYLRAYCACMEGKGYSIR
jgi:hypothetical protein